jgi:hypothetical protein
LLANVRAAFVHGMDLALLVSAGFAVLGIVLTILFLPKSNAPIEKARNEKENHVTAIR